jgi:hypothetical protein
VRVEVSSPSRKVDCRDRASRLLLRADDEIVQEVLAAIAETFQRWRSDQPGSFAAFLCDEEERRARQNEVSP